MGLSVGFFPVLWAVWLVPAFTIQIGHYWLMGLSHLINGFVTPPSVLAELCKNKKVVSALSNSTEYV